MRFAVVAVVAAMLSTGAAGAAVPPAGTLGPTTPFIAWQGQAYASAVGGGSCPPQAVDPANVVCDHFTLDVQAAGPVTVAISWPDPATDFDLYVFSGATLVASSTASSGTSESVTFAADATTYEVRVVPVFVDSPSSYSGTASWASPAGGGGGATCSPGTIEVSLEPIATVCVGVGL